MLAPLADRFWPKVDRQGRGPSGHWLWKGYVNGRGYGYFQTEGRSSTPEPAHRIAWALWGRHIPLGHTLRNVCGERACVNPDHWVLTTRSETQKRVHAKKKGL
jgi:hypothetical protein